MSTRKVAVENLQFNMYVCELDRPWLGSPFMFQGFRISNQWELDQLRECCSHVYVLSDDVPHSSARHSVVAPSSKRFATSQINTSPPIIQHNHSPEHLVSELSQIKNTYDETHHYIHDVMADVRMGRSIDSAKSQVFVGHLVDSIVRNDSALTLLAQLKSKDEYTVQHSLNVCVLVLLFGEFYGLTHEELKVLGVGALLHDIGKMHVPGEVLNKQGPLTDAEFGMMKRHSEIGYQLLSQQGGVPLPALEVLRSHHERMDGSGYPRGLKGGQIKLFPQLVSMIDVYDAITTQRCYHDALSPHEALKLMFEQSLGAFPVKMMNAFVQCLSIFPVGSIVELSNGEVGVVMTVNRARHLLPIVLVVLSADKQMLDRYRLVNLDFIADRGEPLSVRRILESFAYGLDVPRLIREQGDFSHLADG